ncbi:MAG: hypothetical protein EOO19_02265 [Chryseobacterium sp.]|nr:MAG: hypothetical protein EOO19_02265 [Chryseobacterium sp.]
MSRTRIVKGKITEVIEKDYNIFSESDIIDNAAEIVGEKGEKSGLSYGKPDVPPPSTTLINSIVEFRTKQDGSYTGEFGFDWLRIDDLGATNEKAYVDCIEGGYELPNGRDRNTEYESKAEAFRALETQYLQLPIRRTSSPTTTKYYVPWLNLYPESVTVASTSVVKPSCEAELRVLVDVENEEPDQIRLVFDKNYFTIDGKDGTDANPVLVTDKAIGTKRDTGQIIKIKCINEFARRQEILVYGYPKNSLSKPLAEQLVLRKVIGKIVLEPNKNSPAAGKTAAVKNRKNLNVVLVSVIVNINGSPSSGVFDAGFASGETAIFQKGLYQALIETNLIKRFASRSGTTVNATLDLSAVPLFKIHKDSRGNPIDSTYINSSGNIKSGNALLVELKRRFHILTANKYVNDFIVFSFDETCPHPSDPTLVINGFAEATHAGTRLIFKKSAALFKTRRDTTLPHECMHGLGLFHTHKDGAINNPDQNFVFAHARTNANSATDNIMSYRQDRSTTWHWQWKILKRNIR